MICSGPEFSRRLIDDGAKGCTSNRIDRYTRFSPGLALIPKLPKLARQGSVPGFLLGGLILVVLPDAQALPYRAAPPGMR